MGFFEILLDCFWFSWIVSDSLGFLVILMNWYSSTFFEILWDSVRFCEILWDSFRFLEILVEFLRFSRIHWELFWDSLRFFEIPWDSLGFSMIIWDFLGFFGIDRILWIFEILWDSPWFSGILSDSLGFFENPWYSLWFSMGFLMGFFEMHRWNEWKSNVSRLFEDRKEARAAIPSVRPRAGGQSGEVRTDVRSVLQSVSDHGCRLHLLGPERSAGLTRGTAWWLDVAPSKKWQSERFVCFVKDVRWLSQQLTNLISTVRINWADFNHLDFLWGINTNQLLYRPLLRLLPAALI